MKKGSLIKRIVIILVMMGVAGFAVYMMFFRKTASNDEEKCDHWDENGHCIGADGVDHTQAKIDKMKGGGGTGDSTSPPPPDSHQLKVDKLSGNAPAATLSATDIWVNTLASISVQPANFNSLFDYISSLKVYYYGKWTSIIEDAANIYWNSVK